MSRAVWHTDPDEAVAQGWAFNDEYLDAVPATAGAISADVAALDGV